LRVWHLAMVPRVGECTCGPGGYERVEMRRGEVRKRTDVPLQYEVSILIPCACHYSVDLGPYLGILSFGLPLFSPPFPTSLGYP
jgi:hypothetical protein